MLTKRIILTLLSTILLWLVYTGFSIWRFGNIDQAAAADCIIVLGAAVKGDQPSPVFAERIRHGVALYQRGMAAKLLFTGGYSHEKTYAESAVATAFAIKQGVPEADTLSEHRSRTTYQNLLQAQDVMRQHKLDSAIIVSDPLHMKRAMWMADDLALKAVSSPTPTTLYRSWDTQWRFLRRELYFLHHYWLFGE